MVIVKEAEALEGYRDLSTDKQGKLIACLEAERSKKETGLVHKQFAQLHDIRATIDKVSCEVKYIYWHYGSTQADLTSVANEHAPA